MSLSSFLNPGRFALFATFFLGVYAQFGLPPCSAACERKAAASAGCNPNDAACLCKNQAALIQGVNCVSNGCPHEEFDPASKIILNLCQNQNVPIPGTMPPGGNPNTPKPSPTTQSKPPANTPHSTTTNQQQPAPTNTKPANDPTNTRIQSSASQVTGTKSRSASSSDKPANIAGVSTSTTAAAASASGSTLSVSSSLNSTSVDPSATSSGSGPSVADPGPSSASTNAAAPAARGGYQSATAIGAAMLFIMVNLAMV